MSFRALVLLGAAYLIAAVVIALEVPLALTVEDRAVADYRAETLGEAAVLSARVADLVPRPRTPVERRQLQQRLNEVAERTSSRVVVTDAQGVLLGDSSRPRAASERFATQDRPELGVALFEGRLDIRERQSETAGGELLLVTVPVVDEGRVVGAVRISAPLASLQDDVRDRWLTLALIGLALVIAGVGLAALLLIPLNRHLRRLSDASERLEGGDHAARAPEQGPQELAELAGTFNRMADTLTGTVSRQRDFVANASHQLRTPLTGLGLRLEGLEAHGGEVGAEAAKARVELDRLNALVNDLLLLAEVEAEGRSAERVDLSARAYAAAERWRAAGEAAGKSIRVVARDGAAASATAADVDTILDTLIENALRYSADASEVIVEADGRAVRVVNGGPAIPEEDRPRLFERFYRGEQGRKSGPGTGLGLAIVAELARSWDGEARLLDGPLTCFEVTFGGPE